MRGISVQPKIIIQCLSVYREIYTILVKSIDGKSPAVFRSPKPGREGEYKPCIVIYNGNSQKIYQILNEHDHEATQCIMKLIRERFIVPEGEESLFYIIFVLLHEAGHWFDYHNNRSWYNENFTDRICETEEEYRQKPCEKRADQFALDHFEDAWNELTDNYFYGLMEPLEKVKK